MQPYNKYTISPVVEREADLVEQALINADITFSVELRKHKPPLYTTLEIPEQALRDIGFLVWGTRFKLRCRIRAILREGLNV